MIPSSGRRKNEEQRKETMHQSASQVCHKKCTTKEILRIEEKRSDQFVWIESLSVTKETSWNPLYASMLSLELLLARESFPEKQGQFCPIVIRLYNYIMGYGNMERYRDKASD